MGNITAHRLLTNENTIGDITINYLELTVYVTNLHIFALIMLPLYHIKTKVDNTAAEG